MKRLLSGNEAIARAAWEAGVVVGAGYPGTPSTEILEEFAPYPDVYAEWAPNEKVALDVAIGAAYAGRRALATMKHVGLNVAMDSFWSVSMTGTEAGLVIISADDPSIHSSQNEQDNRALAKFARVPCLDPADSQECHDFIVAGYDISERFDTPVVLRPTTRVCHTSAPVEVGEVRRRPVEPHKYPRNVAKYDMTPANARARRPLLDERLKALTEFAETWEHNRIEPSPSGSRELGIVASGIAYEYAREVFPDAVILKLGMVYPLPPRKIAEFAASVDKLVVMEELDPFVEEQIRLMGIAVFRPEDSEIYPLTKSVFSGIGEMDPASVRRDAYAAGLLPQPPAPKATNAGVAAVGLSLGTGPLTPIEQGERVGLPVSVAARPPILCPGCPHRSSFYVLHKMGVPVNGDIGCYTLGMTQPLDAVHTVGCMGAGIAVAHGGAVAGDTERHIAVIGDSTFFHSGIPALLNVIYNRSNVITIILDNRITGMTGHQENPGTGRTLQRQETIELDIEAVVRALGFPEDRVKTLSSYDVPAIEKQLKAWMKVAGPAVLISKEECALLPTAKATYQPLSVNDNCNGCTICFRIGCPSILVSEELDPKHHRPLAIIDQATCTGCEICAQVCPRDAILFKEQVLSHV